MHNTFSFRETLIEFDSNKEIKLYNKQIASKDFYIQLESNIHELNGIFTVNRNGYICSFKPCKGYIKATKVWNAIWEDEAILELNIDEKQKNHILFNADKILNENGFTNNMYVYNQLGWEDIIMSFNVIENSIIKIPINGIDTSYNIRCLSNDIKIKTPIITFPSNKSKSLTFYKKEIHELNIITAIKIDNIVYDFENVDDYYSFIEELNWLIKEHQLLITISEKNNDKLVLNSDVLDTIELTTHKQKYIKKFQQINISKEIEIEVLNLVEQSNEFILLIESNDNIKNNKLKLLLNKIKIENEIKLINEKPIIFNEKNDICFWFKNSIPQDTTYRLSINNDYHILTLKKDSHYLTYSFFCDICENKTFTLFKWPHNKKIISFDLPITKCDVRQEFFYTIQNKNNISHIQITPKSGNNIKLLINFKDDYYQNNLDYRLENYISSISENETKTIRILWLKKHAVKSTTLLVNGFPISILNIDKNSIPQLSNINERHFINIPLGDFKLYYMEDEWVEFKTTSSNFLYTPKSNTLKWKLMWNDKLIYEKILSYVFTNNRKPILRLTNSNVINIYKDEILLKLDWKVNSKWHIKYTLKTDEKVLIEKMQKTNNSYISIPLDKIKIDESSNCMLIIEKYSENIQLDILNYNLILIK